MDDDDDARPSAGPGTPLLPAGATVADLRRATDAPVRGGGDAGAADRARGPDYASHFTLRIPTSTVHFRGALLHVIDTDQDQIILQQRTGDDDDDGRVLVKRVAPGTHAQRALRVGYTLITVLFLGFLFVFCVQVLLLLFIALPIDSGYTSGSQKVDRMALVSTVLSIPVMVYGMSSLMTMGSAFVVDMYNGGALFRSTLVEILYMAVFLVVPLSVYAFGMMFRHPEVWRLTAGVWAVLVCLVFCVWGVAVTATQALACFWLVDRHFFGRGARDASSSSFDDVLWGGDPAEDGQDARVWRSGARLLHVARQALLLTQTARYSGYRQQRFQFAGTDVAAGRGRVPHKTRTSLYARLTALACCARLFTPLDPAQRVYSSEEVRDVLPFMTKENFSMQKMWCGGNSHRRNVVVASGPSALTPHQVRNSLVCTVTSSVVATLTLIGAFAWMGLGLVSYAIVGVFSVLCCILPLIRSGLDTQEMYDGINRQDDDTGENLFQVWETVRITKPTARYCYARVAIECVLLFLWPWINMFVKRNYPVAVVFLLLGSFTFIWRYFDTSVVLSEIGSMSAVVNDAVGHQEMYRLNEVISRVVSDKGRRRWSTVFFALFFAITVMSLGANQEIEAVRPNERPPQQPVLLVDDFYYPGADDSLAYPTCRLAKGFRFPGDGASDLADYVFLSAMAYEDTAVTAYALDRWFGGPGIAVDEDAFVTRFRTESQTASSPLYFKLFSFPRTPGAAVMSIRGSVTAFDWISDMQIWSAAGFAQVVKWMTPFGWVWDPIIPDLVNLVNKVESKQISNVNYYKTTAKFVDDVLAGYGGRDLDHIVVTGTSLGGGLAIITAAQTDAYAVAVSGMGATLSRETFDPPIQLEKLNSQTFDIIPEHDYIARIGGRAPLFQNIDCTAPKQDVFGCHSVLRSLCEVTYKCGSHSRPVYCVCVEVYGYPLPVQNGTRTFADACKEANDDWYEMFPPE